VPGAEEIDVRPRRRLGPQPSRQLVRQGRVEPPLMLALSVVEALGMAVASVADYRVAPGLDTPVTPERVLMGVERMRRARG
jgi:xanthine dehydrogenase molybdopterin-binding subunit B